jgi:Spy/CpxP family protein refolding chaperone
MKNKHPFRLITTGTLLAIALAMFAQPIAVRAGDEQNQGAAPGGAPTLEQQMKLLTDRLELTGDQQEKVERIVREMDDAAHKIMQDESMSRPERQDHARDARYRADREIRAILSDDQKQKLDQLESEPHAELHGE